MGYFRELPNLRYPSFLKEKKSSLDYIEVKNLFRRIKLRDDLQSNFTIFNKYEIEEGMRPDTVAEEMYGSAEFDWIILTVAGILNVRNEWPLNNRDLYNYCFDKYDDSLNSVRFFETKEVKNADGKLTEKISTPIEIHLTVKYIDRKMTIKWRKNLGTPAEAHIHIKKVYSVIKHFSDV